MFKIFVLCIFVSVVAARPSYVTGPAYLPTAYDHYDHYDHHAYAGHPDHHHYAPTIVGHSVEHYPAAVSHQSQTLVHEKRPYLRQIVDYTQAAAYVKAHAPVLTKYVAAPPVQFPYAPESYYNGLYAPGGGGGWDTGLAYTTKGWNGWPLK